MEVVVSVLVLMVLMAAGMRLFKGASDANQLGLARADVQQNARGAISIISRDLSQASIGIPQAGIALPSGLGSTGPARFGCDPTQCSITAPNNQYVNNFLPPVAPHQGIGAGGTDAITIAYLDNTWPVNNLQLTAVGTAGTQITVNTGTFDSAGNPAAAPTGRAYDDPVFGTKVGDVLMLTNQWGVVLATVTGVGAGGTIQLASGDPLNMNQPTAASASVTALKNPGTNTYPITSAARVNIVTYFIQNQAGPDGVIGTGDDVPVLVRQVSAHPAIPITEFTTNIQFAYDVYDPAAVAPALPYTANLTGNAVANTSDIRKISVQLTLRSESRTPDGRFQNVTMKTAVAPRDLSFSNRYQ